VQTAQITEVKSCCQR